jgi:O-acetyl-ADP-ribose deacetylase (regulator of RNase III)
MPLKIIRQDVSAIECDSMVCPTNEELCPTGGTDLAIHEAAGEGFSEYCKGIGRLACGQVAQAPGFNTGAKHILLVVGPTFDGTERSVGALRDCYRRILAEAQGLGCESIAIPLISSGANGFPKKDALRVAVDEITGFLFSEEMLVFLAVYDKESFLVSEGLFSDVQSFIDDRYCESRAIAEIDDQAYYSRRAPEDGMLRRMSRSAKASEDCDLLFSVDDCQRIEDIFKDMDKGFASTLFDYIDMRGISDVECYKRANVDKKTFSKIKCNKDYRPSKNTVVSFAIALRLDLSQTNHLLNTVGLSLSRSSKFDMIIEYFVTTGNYESIFDVNEVLYHFDQTTLGV